MGAKPRLVLTDCGCDGRPEGGGPGGFSKRGYVNMRGVSGCTPIAFPYS